MNIVIIGIQGSGKGTMARMIQEKYPYHLFEMGQKLRNFSKLSLPESAAVKHLIDDGKLVPRELIGKILSHYLATHEEKNIIFDGIPRSIEQKELFDSLVGEYAVFFLELPEDEAIRRLAGRRIDPTTGESFPSDFPGSTNPKTGETLIVRDDDRREAVAKRIAVFMRDTLPLLSQWTREGRMIFRIDASRDIREEFAQIDRIIANGF